MREKKIRTQYVIKQLEKYNFVQIPAISVDWMLEVEHDVLEIYTKVLFWVEQVDDNLYSLFILL